MTTTQTAPSPFAEAWPDGVTHRYLNLAGATVDISSSAKTGYLLASCNGCPYKDSYSSSPHLHAEAQKHASACRALPRPAVAQ